MAKNNFFDGASNCNKLPIIPCDTSQLHTYRHIVLVAHGWCGKSNCWQISGRGNIYIFRRNHELGHFLALDLYSPVWPMNLVNFRCRNRRCWVEHRISLSMLEVMENSFPQSSSVTVKCIKELWFINWLIFQALQNLFDIIWTNGCHNWLDSIAFFNQRMCS